MNDELVLREDMGTVALLVLNRPERRNALSRGLIARLGDALAALVSEAGVRSVVLTGAGATFSAGMDLKEAAALVGDAESEKLVIADMQGIADLIGQIHRLEKPIVAALNGDAFAGGAGLALACDFVIASAESRIGYPEVRRGLVAAVVMRDLVKQAGERRARALLLAGEPIGAEEAERWGLINRVVPAECCRGEAVALARSLSACGPHALALTKRLVGETDGRSTELRGAAAISAAIRSSDEAVEGMRAFLEKRPPRWAIDPK